MSSFRPYLSVVIPVFNEQENLENLYRELTGVLERFGKPYEIIWVDDGSVDRSPEILKELQTQDPHVTIITLEQNFGQYPALFAGFSHAHADVVVTLDADLQNPPDPIPLLVQKIDEGYDVAGGWRKNRQDPGYRCVASWLVNRLTSWRTGVRLRDYGCMLRAYRREIVQQVAEYAEPSNFFPIITNTLARSVIEIPIVHRPRVQGRSKYSGVALARLTFDLFNCLAIPPFRMLGRALQKRRNRPRFVIKEVVRSPLFR